MSPDDLYALRRRLAGIFEETERLREEGRNIGHLPCALVAEFHAAHARLEAATARVREAADMDAELATLHEENARLWTLSPAEGRAASRRVEARIAKAEEHLEERSRAYAELVAARAHAHEVGSRLARELASQEAQLVALKNQLTPLGAEIMRAGQLLGVRPSRGGWFSRLVAILVIAAVAELAGLPVLAMLRSAFDALD